RGYEQIRNCIALPRLPVLFLGPAGGFAYGPEGAPFQLVEDLGLMRLMPEMHVLVPSDMKIYEKLLLECCLRKVPGYIRKVPLLSKEEPPSYCATEWSGPVRIGGARVLREGDGVTLCSYGMMIPQVLGAASILARQGIEAEVLDCYSIKPLPEEVLLSSVRRTGCCVVVEEHAQEGSLGEALGGFLGKNYPVPLLSVNIGCSFGQSGTSQELTSYYSLHSQDVVGAATRAWGMRRRI
ncbi:MAG TPA: transketolase C-terminal domain-containing protein, partial [Synergistaceae bacterium]|nr:transketolase C-terminal domain-containing protein [Synergistaceae bacterium]